MSEVPSKPHTPQNYFYNGISQVTGNSTWSWYKSIYTFKFVNLILCSYIKMYTSEDKTNKPFWSIFVIHAAYQVKYTSTF